MRYHLQALQITGGWYTLYSFASHIEADDQMRNLAGWRYGRVTYRIIREG